MHIISQICQQIALTLISDLKNTHTHTHTHLSPLEKTRTGVASFNCQGSTEIQTKKHPITWVDFWFPWTLPLKNCHRCLTKMVLSYVFQIVCVSSFFNFSCDNTGNMMGEPHRSNRPRIRSSGCVQVKSKRNPPSVTSQWKVGKLGNTVVDACWSYEIHETNWWMDVYIYILYISQRSKIVVMNRIFWNINSNSQ